MKKFTTLLLLLPLVANAEQSIDAKLNDFYQKALEHSDPRQAVALKNSQRAWLKYRDTQCDFEAGTYSASSAEQVKNHILCIDAFNYDRARFLKAIIDETEGI